MPTTTKGNLKHFEACFSKTTKMKNIVRFPLNWLLGVKKLAIEIMKKPSTTSQKQLEWKGFT